MIKDGSSVEKAELEYITNERDEAVKVMSTYSSIDMDIESTGVQEVQQRERNPTERGQTYDAERRKSACLSMQRNLTRQIQFA